MNANDTKEYIVPISYRVETLVIIEACDENDAAQKIEAATRAWSSEPATAGFRVASDHLNLASRPTVIPMTIKVDHMDVSEVSR